MVIRRRAVSRRVLLQGAGAAAAGALAGCGGSSRSGSGGSVLGSTERTDDAEILNGALDVEHLLIASYRHALPSLAPAHAPAARRMLAQEQAHAAALTRVIGDLRATPNGPRSDYGLTRPGSASRALAFLTRAEDVAVGYYLDALPKLSQPLRRYVLGIVANEAEHIALLRSELGLVPAPRAFVTGTA